MATFTFSGGDALNGGFNMSIWNAAFFITLMSDASTLGFSSPTQLLFVNGQNGLELDGAFSSFDTRNIPHSGTVTSLDYISDFVGGPGSEMQVSGLSLSISTMLNFVVTNNVAGMEAALLGGNDVMNGGTFAETLNGEGGADTISGNGGNDMLIGGLGNDVLNGGDGNDQLDTLGLGEGNDTMNGGAGDDAIVARGADIVDGGDGIDTVDIFLDNVSATLSADPYTTNVGAALPGGGSVRNVEILHFWAGSGNDTLIVTSASAGADTFSGGDGIDTVTADFSTSTSNLDLLASTASSFGHIGNFRIEGAEQYHLTAGAGNDTISGGSGNDVINGGAGNDVVITNGGADIVNGGAGDDAVIINAGTVKFDGGAGLDEVSVSFANAAAGMVFDWSTLGAGPLNGSTITNVEGFDITGTTFDDTFKIIGTLSRGSAVGGGGHDTLTIDMTGTTAALDLEGNVITGGSGAFGFVSESFTTVRITGSDVADRMIGTAGNDELSGGGGADFLYGAQGNDKLSGGAGNDTVDLATLDGVDTVDGGAGTDLVKFALYNLTTGVTLTSATFASAAGFTFANGTVLRNFEQLGDATLTQGNDTLDLRNGFGAGAFYDAYLGDDTLIADYSSSSTAITMTAGDNVNFLDGSPVAPELTLLNFEHLKITGSAVGDSMLGSAGGDTLQGFDGDDTLSGKAGNDFLSGGNGDDILIGGAGADDLRGAAGVDTVSYAGASGGVSVNLATGIASGSDAVGDIFSSIESLIGGNFADKLTGTSAVNSLHGGEGDDVLVGGAGADVLNGGNGIDTADYSASSAAVFVDLHTGSAVGVGGDAQGDTLDEIENLTGSKFNDVLVGGPSQSVLNGGAGDDLLGCHSFDVLDGGAGTDTADFSGLGDFVIISLVEGALNFDGHFAQGATFRSVENVIGTAFGDTFTGTDAANVLDGAAGADILHGGAGDDRLIGRGGADTLDGGLGVDTADYSGSAAGVNISLLAGTAAGGDAVGDTFVSIENIVGTVFNDTLVGSAAVNVLTAGAGNDTMNGGDGNDTLIGGAGADKLTGGNDVDVASYATATAGVTANLFDRALNTGDAAGDIFSSIEGLVGSAFNDTLVGNSAANKFDGGAGADTMIGGAGNDTYIVDNAGDVVSETLSASGGIDKVFSSISYTLGANLENLTFTGNAAIDGIGNSLDNTLYGNSAANTLNAGVGNDTLLGNGGHDILKGGAGADTFVFSSINAADSDTITDFVSGSDKIQFDNAVLTALGPDGALASTAFWASTTGVAHDGDDRILYNTNTGQLYYDADGNGAGAAVLIATLTAHPAVAVTDIFII